MYRTHGLSHTPEHRAWSAMRQRCTNPRHPEFHNYGGRGLTVCQRWDESFAAFYADMGPRPSAGHSLERVNNDAGYEPSNCIWATDHAQTRNSRHSRVLTWLGKTQCVTDWAREYHLETKTLLERLNRQIPFPQLLDPPLPTRSNLARRPLHHNGRTMWVADWARHVGVAPNTLRARLRLGWPIDRALTAGDQRGAANRARTTSAPPSSPSPAPPARSRSPRSQ